MDARAAHSIAPEVTLTLPVDQSYMTIARLTISGVAAKMGFDVEQIDDIKDACTEALCAMMRNSSASKSVEIRCVLGLTELCITLCTDSTEAFSENSVSKDIVASLMDKISWATGCIELHKMLPAGHTPMASVGRVADAGV